MPQPVQKTFIFLTDREKKDSWQEEVHILMFRVFYLDQFLIFLIFSFIFVVFLSAEKIAVADPYLT